MEAFETITRTDIKRNNRLRIYNLLRTEGEHSCAEISQKLGLSLPTVGKNIAVLEKDKMVLSYEGKNDTGGRSPRIYNADPRYRVAIGVSITNRHICANVLDLRGNVIAHYRERERFVREDAYFQKIADAVAQVRSQVDVPDEAILGVSLVIPALITKDGSSTYYNGVLHLDAHVDCAEFAKFIPYPTRFAHDASSAAFAENWYRHDSSDFIYMMVSDTICSAPILGQNPYAGINNRSGELGHVTMIPNGRPCYCGKKGCIDCYITTRILSDAAGGDLALFFERLSAGDPEMTAVWNDYLQYLIVSINMLRLLYDCNIVIGGYLGQYVEDYLDTIRELAREQDPFSDDIDYISACVCKKDASATGGALHLIDRFIRTL